MLSTRSIYSSYDNSHELAFAFYYAKDRRVLVGLIVLWILNSGATMVLSILIRNDFPVFHSITPLPGVIGECEAASFPRLLHDVW